MTIVTPDFLLDHGHFSPGQLPLFKFPEWRTLLEISDRLDLTYPRSNAAHHLRTSSFDPVDVLEIRRYHPDLFPLSSITKFLIALVTCPDAPSLDVAQRITQEDLAFLLRAREIRVRAHYLNTSYLWYPASHTNATKSVGFYQSATGLIRFGIADAWSLYWKATKTCAWWICPFMYFLRILVLKQVHLFPSRSTAIVRWRVDD